MVVQVCSRHNGETTPRSIFTLTMLAALVLELFSRATELTGQGQCVGNQQQQTTFMELFPIVLAIKLWGKCIQNQKVIFFCDNQAVVAMINKQSIPQPKPACS